VVSKSATSSDRNVGPIAWIEEEVSLCLFTDSVWLFWMHPKVSYHVWFCFPHTVSVTLIEYWALPWCDRNCSYGFSPLIIENVMTFPTHDCNYWYKFSPFLAVAIVLGLFKCTPSHCFTWICFTPFSFNIPCQFTSLVNIPTLIFSLTPFGWLHSIMLTHYSGPLIVEWFDAQTT